MARAVDQVWNGSKLPLLVLLLMTSVSERAMAQDVSSPSARNARTLAFNIPSKPLLAALADFTATTRIQVVRPNAEAFSGQSASVTGNLTPAQALARLLAGSGLTYRFTGASTVTIQRSANEANAFTVAPGTARLDVIDVVASHPTSTMGAPPAPYAGGQVATGGQVGLLGNRNVMDTPFNQTNYTQKTIQDQQARTLNDVFANDPSVSPLMGRSSPFTTTYFRGFLSQTTSNSDYSLNGLFGIVPANSPSMELMERVEVLKGPSALLNGMPPAGATGGTANLVTKRAQDEPLTQLTTSYQSKSQLGAHIDIGRRFGEDKAFGLRFNGSYRDGKTAVDPQKDEQAFGALGLDYRGSRVRLSADIGHQENKTNPYNNPLITSLTTTVPPPPDASRSLMPSWTFFNTKSTFGMVQGEVDLTDSVTAYAAIGAQKFDWNRVFSNLILQNPNGNYFAQTAYQKYFMDTVSGQAGVRAVFATGPIDHTLSVNLSEVNQTEGPGGIGANTVNVFSNIYNPSFGPMPGLIEPYGGERKATESRMSSVGVADTLSILDKRVQLTVGVRRQRVSADSFDTTTFAQTSGYAEYAWSPAYALVLKPWENVSLYANYIEGLQQGTIVGSGYTNTGEVFPPYQSKQMEIGAKVDWGKLTTTVSAFDITRPSTIDIPGVPPTLKLDGEQRNRGIEVNVFGELTPEIRVLGGAAFIDGRLAKTQNGTNDGRRAQGVPEMRLVLGGEWDTPFMRGFTLTGRVTHTDEQFISNASNTLTIPAWTRLDLGARYTFASPYNQKPVTVRFSVENVLDNNYWVTGYVGAVSLSEPRTYLLSTTVNF